MRDHFIDKFSLNPSMPAHAVVVGILCELSCRGGFTNWWGCIDDDIQHSIVTDLVVKVRAELAGTL